MSGKGTGMALALLATSFAAQADDLGTLRYAFSGGTPNLDVRARYERVDQDNALNTANAGTVRTRLGYTTGKWNLFDAMVEMENIVALGGGAYNNNRPGGNTAFPVVADPAGTELNQAWLRYAGIPGTVLKYGRQRIILDNARFIGNVGWRQNEATFDAYLGTNTLVPTTTITYAFLTDVNTVTFADLRLHGHVANVAFAPLDEIALSAYAYLLDWDASATSAPAAATTFAPPQREDSKSIGLRATGSVPVGPVKLGYAAEYARQSSYQDSAIHGSNYELAEISVTGAGATGKLGFEVLGGDGTDSFQTPLATLHAFQGWADQFLVTPRAGIRELYVSGAYTIAKVALLARWSKFDADEGGARFGSEIDAQVTYPINDSLMLGAKYADFSADTAPLVDTAKTWAWVEYKF
jgi:hypothetical protein